MHEADLVVSDACFFLPRYKDLTVEDSQLQTSNFAAGAERNGAKTADGGKNGNGEINLSKESFTGAASNKAGEQGGKSAHEYNLANERFTGAASRESFLAEKPAKSVESKSSNVPEAANKQKLKEN
jgi:hypothetical protein